MNSYLITGADQQTRLEKAKEFATSYDNNPDLFIVAAQPSVGIGQIRQIQKFLSRKPYQEDQQTVVLSQAELMTIPAQNAFLKTLEEPPKHSQIILCSPQKEDLLPTIISRCQIIHLKTGTPAINHQKMTADTALFTKILQSGPGQRLQLIEPYTKNREEAINFCQQTMLALRTQLPIHTPSINQLQKAINLLAANVNVKLVLENLVLAL